MNLEEWRKLEYSYIHTIVSYCPTCLRRRLFRNKIVISGLPERPEDVDFIAARCISCNSIFTH